jgi:alpha-1,6-mannosyltransferase
VHVLVEAMRRLADREDLQLAFVGAGPAIPELLRKAATDPRLHVLPYQKEPRALARLLASADLYVTAGPHETFGLSVIEAQACGLPVVGVRAGALVERVSPGLGLLGEPDDAEEFAQNIRLILSQDLAAIGARARQLVVENYSWKQTFETLLGIYRDLLAAQPGAARRTPLQRHRA